MLPLRMATHPDAPGVVPLFCREPSAGAAIAAPAIAAPAIAAPAIAAPPSLLPLLPLLPVALPDDAESDDSFTKPVFMDYSTAGVPPNAPLMPGARLLHRFRPRAASQGSVLDCARSA